MEMFEIGNLECLGKTNLHLNHARSVVVRKKFNDRSDDIANFMDKVSKITGIISVAFDDHYMFEFNYCGLTIYDDTDDFKHGVVINLKRSFKRKQRKYNIYFWEENKEGQLMYLYRDFVGFKCESWSFEKLLKMIEDEYVYYILNYEDEDSIDYQKSIRGIK